MSHIGEHRSFTRAARDARKRASKTTDQEERRRLLAMAEDFEHDANFVWDAAGQEAVNDYEEDADYDSY